MSQHERLLNSIRTVGIIKPIFNPGTQTFEQPKLSVLGTGFWLKDNIFITCAHVVQELLSGPLELVGMLVVGGNGQPYVRSVIEVLDLKRDLAVLKVEKIPNQTHSVFLDVLGRDIEIGEVVRFAGYPLGNLLLNAQHTPIFSQGVIAHGESIGPEGRKQIKISGHVKGGYSGSPVVDKDDNLVGIISNHPNETENIFNIVSWKHIKSLIDLSNS